MKFRDIETQVRQCPLCNSAESRLVFSDINRREGLQIPFSVVECRDCSMRYLNPVPDTKLISQYYREGVVDPVRQDRIAVSPTKNKPGVPVGHSIFSMVNGIFRGHPHDWPNEEGDGRNILDFGCHDGEKLVHWYRNGWEVAGVDLNEPAISFAMKRFPEARFWCGDLLKMEIPCRFDVIRADNVLEHLSDPISYLAALVRLLKPGGFLRVFVPNGRALSVSMLGRYSYVYWLPFHLNFFDPKTLRLAMERAGLASTECKVFSPVGSWMHSQRQLLLSPGFDLRPISLLDRAIRNSWWLNYPGETVAQWIGLGEEVIGTGRTIP